MRVALLPAGNRLTQWISAGGRVDRARVTSVWAYRWRARWFEHNLRLQQSLFPAQGWITAPIFVMGFWRSGTTYLHEMLTAALAADTPLTWQCFNPSAFRLGGKPRSVEDIQRPMDTAIIRTDSPQEDEFALLAAGVDSAYRCFLDPRRWRDVLPTLTEEFWLKSGHAVPWIDRLDEFLEGCMSTEGRPFVLKSPNHLFRGAALKQHWPKAKFVWVLRNPQDVRRSNLKMWQAMAERYALWKWAPGDIESLVDYGMEAYLVVLRRLRSANYAGVNAVLRFEDLVGAPRASLLHVCGGLGLGEADLRGPLPEANTPASSPEPASPPSEERLVGLLEAIAAEHAQMLAAFPAPRAATLAP